MIIFEEEYCDDSLGDLQEELYARINKLLDDGTIEQDENFFTGGKFIVQVVWKEGE